MSAPRGRLHMAAPIGVAVVICAGLYFFLVTDHFSLREVQVLGGSGLPIDSLRMVTAGLVGENIFTVPLGTVRRELMRFPEVKEVTFRRRLFHRLDCYCKGREPAVLIAVDAARGQDLIEVDAEGVLVPRNEGATEIDLPVVTGIGRDEIGTESGRRKIDDALELIVCLRSFGFSPAEQLSEIHFEGEEMMVILIGTGSTVRVGRGEYRTKIRKLRTVYAALDEQDRFPDLIDLRFERQVIVR
jgi:cell division septal protein FtsQ